MKSNKNNLTKWVDEKYYTVKLVYFAQFVKHFTP